MISGVLEDGNKTFEFNCDEKEVKEFNEMVKNNASIVTHMDYISTNESFYKLKPYIDNTIRNVQVFNAGYDSKGRRKYHFIYDKYEYPYLVSLIDNFLDGDMTSLFYIIHPDFEKEYIPIFDEVKKEINNLGEINSSNIDTLLEKIDIIKKLLNDIKLGKIDIPIKEYYDEFLNVINLSVKNNNTLSLKNDK